ncbi:hypothetical protein C0J52_25981 [Blattella germanica]|nr:hypothetical protein C0J52_25981 [Blattella germanica]
MNQDEEVLLKREDGASQLMDDLIQQADSSGVFQKLFNFLFNFCAIVLAVMCVQGLVLAMSVPDHWCHVPGRENTNMTLKQWKRLTVPTLFPESPRWLASKGKTGRCMNTLRTIVASSGQKLPDNAEATVRKLMEQSPVKTQGPLNFLSSRTLTKNTALLIILW